MSLVASPIRLDNCKISHTKNTLITYSPYPSPFASGLMNGTKTQSGIFINSLDSADPANSDVLNTCSTHSHSTGTSPVSACEQEATTSIPNEMSIMEQNDGQTDVENDRGTVCSTTTMGHSVTDPVPDYLFSPTKRARFDGLGNTHNQISTGLPCPCGKQFPDSVTFVDHARHCEEFALTANSFAEAAAAVASATNGLKTLSSHSSPSSVRQSKPVTPITRPEQLDTHSPETSSNSTEDNDLVGKNGLNTISSGSGAVGSGHLALDLSVRSQDSQVRRCPECKYTNSSLPHLYHHFENAHDIRGHFDCGCGESCTWLPTLLKHRLNCPLQHRVSSATVTPVSGSIPINALSFTQSIRSPSHSRHNSADVHSRSNPDWPPGTHVVPAPKTLHCTACGKTGFNSPNEVLNHFTHCPILMHRSRSPSNPGMPLPSNPFSRPSPTGPGQFGHWPSASSSASSLYSAMSTLPTSTGHNRSDQGYSPPGFPLGFMSPLGYSPYSKPYSPKANMTAFAGKPVQKGPNKSNEMRSVGGSKDAPTAMNHHHHHGHSISGHGMGSVPTNHNEPQTSPDLTRPFKCCHCIKAFKSKALLDQHMHIHYPPKYTCRYCAKKYRWPPVFYHHQRTCKKRPPSTSASTTSSNGPSGDNGPSGTTVTAAHTFHTRSTNSNGMNTTDSSLFPLPPGYFFSSPMDHSSSPNHNHSQAGSVQHANTSKLSNPFPFPTASSHPNLHGHPFGPDLFGASLAAYYDPLSMGTSSNSGFLGNVGSTPGGIGTVPNPSAMLAAAAACAAMGMRVPFGPPLPPPPLGFHPPYNTRDSPLLNPAENPTARVKPENNGTETLIFSSAMAAMNAIMSSTQHLSDSSVKEDHSVPELASSSLSESERTGLSESTWSGDNRPHQPSDPDSSPNVTTRRRSTSDPDEFMNEHSPQNVQLSDMKVKSASSSISEKSWNSTHPNTTAKNDAALDSNETNPPRCDTDLITSTGDAPTRPNSTTTVTTPTTTLMAAMATVLANAAAAVGFPCPGLSDELSPSVPGTPIAQLQCTESDSLTNSNVMSNVSSAMMTMMMMNGSMHAKLCVQCGKEFSSRLSLKQHVEGKHSAEGKYQCPGCAKRYRWGASYYYHKKSCPAIREPSPMSTTELFLDACDEQDMNEST
ncbi:unnamed protein product, partial [Echinostoma caproni]|uniref:C2H2-type domain-containing protein n=1 Tax=Echinostoma caproni TaxID=27848 RepID=A0A183APK7_9TREM